MVHPFVDFVLVNLMMGTTFDPSLGRGIRWAFFSDWLVFYSLVIGLCTVYGSIGPEGSTKRFAADTAFVAVLTLTPYLFWCLLANEYSNRDAFHVNTQLCWFFASAVEYAIKLFPRSSGDGFETSKKRVGSMCFIYTCFFMARVLAPTGVSFDFYCFLACSTALLAVAHLIKIGLSEPEFKINPLELLLSFIVIKVIWSDTGSTTWVSTRFLVNSAARISISEHALFVLYSTIITSILRPDRKEPEEPEDEEV